jgi:hypothetical protein
MPANNKGWEQEISLDLDAVSAVCPNCHIVLVEATTNAWGDLATALQTAVAAGAKQVANSYSGYWWGTWPYTDTFPGVSVVAATGDHSYQQDVPLSVVANSAVWVQTPDTTFTATWKRCDAAGTNCRSIDGANATQYTPSRSDVGHALVLAITATNPDGSATSTSTPTQVIVPAAPRWRALPLVSADPGRVGDVLTITPGVWSGPPMNSDDVQMMRCTNTCSAVGPADATSYTITSDDLGAILCVREYATNAGGYTLIWSARFVGPVASAASGLAVVADNTDARVRNTQGTVLALASLRRT